MHVIDRYREEDAVATCEGVRLRPDGSREPVRRAVLAEHAM